MEAMPGLQNQHRNFRFSGPFAAVPSLPAEISFLKVTNESRMKQIRY
jgi:hypothetical protein